MKYIAHMFVAFLMLIFSCVMSQASDRTVTLRANLGDIVLEGELVDYTGKHYRIKSKLYGTMTVDADQFSCVGKACPKPQARANSFKEKDNEFNIVGSPSITRKIIPGLIGKYAEHSKMTLKKLPDSQETVLKLQLTQETKKTIITITGGNPASTFSSLTAGKAQIGASSRPAKITEKEAVRQSRSKQLTENIVALDAFAIIVSPSNKVSSLNTEQLAKIFSGEIRDWSEVGGKRGIINVYSRNPISGSFDTFNSLVLKPYNMYLSGRAKRFSSNKKLVTALSTDPNGIGYVSSAFATKVKALAIGKACGPARKPTPFFIKTQEYPLVRKLFLYTTKKTTHPIAKDFIKFTASGEAEMTIRSSGFFDRSVELLGFDLVGDRLLTMFSNYLEENERQLVRKFVSTFRYGRRLSTTFHFKPNTLTLNAASVEELLKLGAFIQKQALSRKKIYIIGFSDSVGDFGQNQEIALLRAKQVKLALIEIFGDQIGKKRLIVESYGELLPSECNATREGRERNRRVEIWLGD